VNNHKIRAVIAVLVLLGLLAGWLWPVMAQNPPRPGQVSDSRIEYKAGEILVKFRAGLSSASAERVSQRYDASYVRNLDGSDIEVWHVPQGSELATAARLNDDPLIDFAEPNYRVYAFDRVPNDPLYGNQWAHGLIQSPAAWDIVTGEPTVTIAILDTGIDETHPDLAGKIVGGYDYIDNDTDPHDLNGHGTHVAGIAAAVTDNGLGVAGMTWEARIMPVRVLDAEGAGYVDILAEGIIWAYANGAEVLNISLGGYGNSQSLVDAVNLAHAAGSLVVAAMGNDDSGARTYPAANNHVLAVAATDRHDLRAPYSNYGAHCDVAAPGGYMTEYQDPDGIYSTMPTYDVYMTTSDQYLVNYDYVQGTSQAVPYVAGLAALLWSLEPSLTPDQVQATIKATAVDGGAPGWDQFYGHGRIDALAAVCTHSSSPATPILSPIDNPGGEGTYLVDWNDVPYAVSYTLEEADNPFFIPSTVHDGLSNSQFKVIGNHGGSWYYRVRANSPCGNSAWSDTRQVLVSPDRPAMEPIVNPGRADAYWVTWDAPAGATSYTLEEDDSSDFLSPTVRYRGNALAYEVTGQREGTWHYRVWAHNAAGDSDPSAPQLTTVDPAPLPGPDLNPIVNDDKDGDYLVTWSEVTTATSYLLEESRNPYFVTAGEILTTGLQYHAVDQPGGTWHYRVRALGAEGDSPWSDPQSAVVPVWRYFPLVSKEFYGPAAGEEIENGDFEQGRVVWTEFSARGRDLIRQSGFPNGVAPHSGTWATWLGGASDELATIEQEVTVPADKPYLHYWHWIKSEDFPGYDQASVWANGVSVETYDLDQDADTGGWVLHIVDLGAYAGQSVVLQIRVETDDILDSSLFIDDLSFGVGAAASK
jgi:thermitase